MYMINIIISTRATDPGRDSLLGHTPELHTPNSTVCLLLTKLFSVLFLEDSIPQKAET